MANQYDWITFSTTLNGREVRFSVPFEEIEILSQDNGENFDTIENIGKLENIEFEVMY